MDWFSPVVNYTLLFDPPSPTPSFHSAQASPTPSFHSSESSWDSNFVPPSLDSLLFDTITGLNKTLSLSAYSSGLTDVSNDYLPHLPPSDTMLPAICTIVDVSQPSSPSNPTLPPQYQDFAKVFSRTEADKLPRHCPYDHKIPLVTDALVTYGPMYSMSQLELKTLYDYIKENLAKGFIRRSESPAGAPVLFVKKKDGFLRMVVDYRGLNKVTIATPAVLPLISETLDRLNQAKYFSRLDMVKAYNLIRIQPGDEWKTTWICRYGRFEYTVMCFGLCSAPRTF